MKLKVLQLEPWMIFSAMNVGKPGWTGKQIEPILNRDGFYWDRELGYSWFESKGVAFSYSLEHFKYALSVHDHRPLTEKEVAAILTLKASKIPNNLGPLLLRDVIWKTLRRTRREARKNAMRFKRLRTA